MNYIRLYRRALLLLLLGISLTTCVDPTAPEFQLEDPFYLVEGRILAGEEGSEIRVRESAFREANKLFVEVSGAEVITRESGGNSVVWAEIEEKPGFYRPPADFRAAPGQTWWTEVTFPDGTQARSEPETIPVPVALTDVRIRFAQNSVYDQGLDRFVPRFEIYGNFDDPAGNDNYYAFDYRYWEEVIACASCFNGIYREGMCITRPRIFRYDYLCDTDECYRITPGNQVVYSDDAFTDGVTVIDYPFGGINFEAVGGLLVEGILLSITPDAYDYGKVIQDLTTGNAGLNATTPAALNGNIRNLDPDGQTVLGFVQAASASRMRAFTERSFETGTPLPFDPVLRLEPSNGFFVPPRAPCEIEGRTSVRPEGWGG